MNDWQLLERYRTHGSEQDFAALVERHIKMIHSVCLRDIGDSGLAEDATQVVFTILARKAATLRRSGSLAGWLFQTARFVTAAIRKREARRVAKEARMQREIEMRQGDAVAWDTIEPLLNDAIDSLASADRTVVLMRFFEEYSFPEIGEAIGTTAEAAQKRTARAVDKLKKWLGRHGVTATPAILAAVLAERGASAATPLNALDMAHTVMGIAGSPALSATGNIGILTEGVLRTMSLMKLKLAGLAASAVLVVTVTTPFAARAIVAARTKSRLVLAQSAPQAAIQQAGKPASIFRDASVAGDPAATLLTSNDGKLSIGIRLYPDGMRFEAPSPITDIHPSPKGKAAPALLIGTDYRLTVQTTEDTVTVLGSDGKPLLAGRYEQSAMPFPQNRKIIFDLHTGMGSVEIQYPDGRIDTLPAETLLATPAYAEGDAQSNGFALPAPSTNLPNVNPPLIEGIDLTLTFRDEIRQFIKSQKMHFTLDRPIKEQHGTNFMGMCDCTDYDQNGKETGKYLMPFAIYRSSSWLADPKNDAPHS